MMRLRRLGSIGGWTIIWSGLVLMTAGWGKDGQADRDRLNHAIEVLGRVKSGERLLQRAQEFWKVGSAEELRGFLRWGLSSRTDAVLTRHYNPTTGEESRERKVLIYLREGQSLEELTLDMAHELIHATSKPGWDPYDPSLTGARYIFSAIEGAGGEVEAVETECLVAAELSKSFGTSLERCKNYLHGTTVLRERIRADFYKVGTWYDDLVARLGAELATFPLLSKDTPKLYSSTGRTPYPHALLKEFDEITSIACENTKRRISAVASRAPASETASDPAVSFLAQRCK